MKTIKFTYEDDDGNEVDVYFPANYEVCGACHGEGKHVNRNIDGNGITAEEWAEICHDDPDFPEEYMSGKYDVICEECNGLRVVLEIDLDTVENNEKFSAAYKIYCDYNRYKREENYEAAYFNRMER